MFSRSLVDIFCEQMGPAQYMVVYGGDGEVTHEKEHAQRDRDFYPKNWY